ncbi:hypothetical protein BC829DRAFT_60199 [Chytridium lagenaria]|nr:hypothetical protein BC829DRAFT_60199 [Chytridium lagenaria]
MSLHSKLDGGSVRPSSSWIHRAIDDVKCLTVMLQPLSIFAVMSVMGLVAAKLILNFSVVDETGMPFADDTKAFGLLTYLTMGICIVSIYFKETFWINPHVDYILVAIPFIILGPLIWCLTRITFLNASYKFLIISIMPNFVFGPILFLDKSMTFAKFIRHALRQLVELFVFILVSIFNLAVSLTFLTLSRTENHGKAVSVVEMVKAVCLFGIVFPILRFFSMQGARRGLKAHEAKEPTNVLEEMEMKNILFRFIACQEMLWNTLSRLLLAEIRDNTTRFRDKLQKLDVLGLHLWREVFLGMTVRQSL